MMLIFIAIFITVSFTPIAYGGGLDAEFKCTSDGYFPNIQNCSEFFFCTPEGPHKYECPPNYVYHVGKMGCSPKSDGDCPLMKCVTAHAYIVHPWNNAYYGYCSVVDCVAETIMYRCDYPATHKFNPDINACEFTCSAEGRYPREENCREFNECYRADNKWVYQIKACVDNYIFDPVARICVPGTC